MNHLVCQCKRMLAVDVETSRRRCATLFSVTVFLSAEEMRSRFVRVRQLCRGISSGVLRRCCETSPRHMLTRLQLTILKCRLIFGSTRRQKKLQIVCLSHNSRERELNVSAKNPLWYRCFCILEGDGHHLLYLSATLRTPGRGAKQNFSFVRNATPTGRVATTDFGARAVSHVSQ